MTMLKNRVCSDTRLLSSIMEEDPRETDTGKRVSVMERCREAAVWMFSSEMLGVDKMG